MKELINFWKDMSVGQSIRVPHKVCSPCRDMIVTRKQTGVHAYCFRCKESMWYSPESYTREDLSLIKKKSLDTVSNGKLPDDFTTSIPVEKRVWFYKYGVTDALISKHGFGYSPSLDRLVMPYYNKSGSLAFMQMRSNDPTAVPKYVSMVNTQCMFEVNTLNPLLPEAVVLTEDILSAVKVGQVQTSASLLGTSFLPGYTDSPYINNNEHTLFILWLDPDKAGKVGSATIAKKLSLLGKRTYVLETERDPKCYSKEQIRNLLLKVQNSYKLGD